MLNFISGSNYASIPFDVSDFSFLFALFNICTLHIISITILESATRFWHTTVALKGAYLEALSVSCV